MHSHGINQLFRPAFHNREEQGIAAAAYMQHITFPSLYRISVQDAERMDTGNINDLELIWLVIMRLEGLNQRCIGDRSHYVGYLTLICHR